MEETLLNETQPGAETAPAEPHPEFDPDFLADIEEARNMSLEDAIAGDSKPSAPPTKPVPKANPEITPKLARIMAFLMGLDLSPAVREQFVRDIEHNELIVFILDEMLDFPGAFAQMGGQGLQNLPPAVRLFGGLAVLAGVSFMTKGAYAAADRQLPPSDLAGATVPGVEFKPEDLEQPTAPAVSGDGGIGDLSSLLSGLKQEARSVS
ncbi:MAG: hypothetical protein N2318_03495 [Meiothermus sp.]|nr:hypothetical protein [Meiothermus sp.]